MLQFLQSMPEERAFSLCDGHNDAKCSKDIILNNPTLKKIRRCLHEFFKKITIFVPYGTI